MQTVTERVWVPPRCERVWVPPVFRLERDRCGRTRQVILQAGYWQTVRHPGFWDTRCREVIVPGRWEQVCGHPEGR